MAKADEKPFNVDVPLKLRGAFERFQAREGRDKKLLAAAALYQLCTLDEYGVIETLRAMRTWLHNGGDEIPIADDGGPPGKQRGAESKGRETRPRQAQQEKKPPRSSAG